MIFGAEIIYCKFQKYMIAENVGISRTYTPPGFIPGRLKRVACFDRQTSVNSIFCKNLYPAAMPATSEEAIDKKQKKIGLGDVPSARKLLC